MKCMLPDVQNKYIMTYTRINEQFIDDEEIKFENKFDFVKERVYREIESLIEDKNAEISTDLCSLPDAYYKISGNDELSKLIKNCIEKFGEECNLNWIDVSGITGLRYLFSYTDSQKFNGDISRWDVSHVEDMSYMFFNSQFNGDISNWDVSHVTMMVETFSNSEFNRDISRWDVRNVRYMFGMFGHSLFNGDISRWDVSSAVDMSSMFQYSRFNGDISDWNVSNVRNMSHMFYKSNFNGDISEWDVSNVVDMSLMFYKSPFKGDISKWNNKPKVM